MPVCEIFLLYCFPGHSIFIAAFMCHRDPKVFQNPEEFNPDRWKATNSGDKEKLFTLGYGARKCPGEKFMWKFLKRVLNQFLSNFKWNYPYECRERKLKYLPVTRASPLEETMIFSL